MTYNVKEIAAKTGLTEHAVRYYTNQGLLPCGRDAQNRRVFDDSAVGWLTGIRCLRSCGVSIEDIREYCRLCRMGDSSLDTRYRFMLRQRQLAYVRLKEAQEMVEYIEYKVRHYEEILNKHLPDDMNPAAGSAGLGKP